MIDIHAHLGKIFLGQEMPIIDFLKNINLPHSAFECILAKNAENFLNL